MNLHLDVPDEDVLEEFEEIGQAKVAVNEADNWTKFEHASWDDADLDDTFTETLMKELAACGEQEKN